MKIQFRGQNFEIPELMRNNISEKIMALKHLFVEKVNIYITLIKFQKNLKLEIVISTQNSLRLKEEIIENNLESALNILITRIEKQFKKSQYVTS
ncbi:HPF/RaiA family ribosome-associated protein [Priestia aryabhattai]